MEVKVKGTKSICSHSFVARNVVAAGAARKEKVTKWQDWKGLVVGIFASLGLIGCAGVGAARAAVASPEPSFELPTEVPTEEGVAHATLASPEPSFELPTEVRTEEGVAHTTVASPSEQQLAFGQSSCQKNAEAASKWLGRQRRSWRPTLAAGFLFLANFV